MIRAIVAVDKNWAIGKEGKLLTNIPDDQRFFRLTTTDQVVIMGRKTLESLPGGKPLPNRVNVIMTRNEDFHESDVIIAHSVEEALEAAKKEDADIYIAGGKEIYVDRAHAAKLGKDEVYISDLIGCEAFTREGEKVGVLIDVLQYGTVDTYVFRTKHGSLMAPALKAVFVETDVENRKIVVDRERLEEVAVLED